MELLGMGKEREVTRNEGRKCMVNKCCLFMQVRFSQEQELPLRIALFLVQAPFLTGTSFIDSFAKRGREFRLYCRQVRSK